MTARDAHECSDLELADFLGALDASVAVQVSDWEARFLESNLRSSHFSPAQRDVIGRMVEKYGHRIGWEGTR